MVDRFARIPPPPMLRMPEHQGDIPDTFQRIRKRFGLIEEWLGRLHVGVTGATAAAAACTPFRWIYTTQATVDDTGLGAQEYFTLPVGYELENTWFHIVFARTSHLYYTADYTIDVVNNRIRILAGVLLGKYLTIYALKHNDIQEVYYETCAIPAVPYTFSPPVTVDRAGGRQLVFARTSPRFLDSGRPGDEYTVSTTLNTISLTAGLGPVDESSAIYRLIECGCLFHEEVLATVAGQKIFTIVNLDNRIIPHSTGKLIVFAGTSFRHPYGVDYVTDVGANTLELLGSGLAVDQPLNVWCYK